MVDVLSTRLQEVYAKWETRTEVTRNAEPTTTRFSLDGNCFSPSSQSYYVRCVPWECTITVNRQLSSARIRSFSHSVCLRVRDCKTRETYMLLFDATFRKTSLNIKLYIGFKNVIVHSPFSRVSIEQNSEVHLLFIHISDKLVYLGSGIDFISSIRSDNLSSSRFVYFEIDMSYL